MDGSIKSTSFREKDPRSSDPIAALLEFSTSCHGGGLLVKPSLTVSCDAAINVLATEIVVHNRHNDRIQRSFAQLYPDVNLTIRKVLEILDEVVCRDPRRGAAWPLSRDEELACLLHDEARLKYMSADGLNAILDERDRVVQLGGKELHRFDTINEDRFDEAIWVWQHALPYRIAAGLKIDRMVEYGLVNTSLRRDLQPLLVQPGDRISLAGCPEEVSISVRYASLGKMHELPPGSVLVAKLAWLEHAIDEPAAKAAGEPAEAETGASAAMMFMHSVNSTDLGPGDKNANEWSDDEEATNRAADAAPVDDGDPLLLETVAFAGANGQSRPDAPRSDNQTDADEGAVTNGFDYGDGTVDWLRGELSDYAISPPTDLEEDELAVVAEAQRAPAWLTRVTKLSPVSLTGVNDFEGLPRPEFWSRSDLPPAVRCKVVWKLIEQWQMSFPEVQRPDLLAIRKIELDKPSYKTVREVASVKQGDDGFGAALRAALRNAGRGVDTAMTSRGTNAAILLLSGVFGFRTGEFLEALSEENTARATQIVETDIEHFVSISA